MAKKNVKTTLTVADFRSWLEGVEDMQEPGWNPTLEQWKKIRDKIELLEEVDYDELLSELKNKPTQIVPQHQQMHRSAPIPAAPSFLDDPAGGPKFTTVIPTPPNSIIGSDKTPNIDTSAGEYPSAFL